MKNNYYIRFGNEVWQKVKHTVNNSIMKDWWNSLCWYDKVKLEILYKGIAFSFPQFGLIPVMQDNEVPTPIIRWLDVIK